MMLEDSSQGSPRPRLSPPVGNPVQAKTFSFAAGDQRYGLRLFLIAVPWCQTLESQASSRKFRLLLTPWPKSGAIQLNSSCGVPRGWPYLVLAGQYESWLRPLAVILSGPLSLLGVAAALAVSGLPNDLYTQIGLILLIALSAKNAILIVEYARDEHEAGASVADAAVEAARRRMRPILMTSFAFILGVFPLVIAAGAGAAARQSIGIAVFSGMLASTLLAMLFVPSFFAVLERIRDRKTPDKATTRVRASRQSLS